MISRRTLMKYTGLAWLGSILEVPDGGSEQLPTNISENPWDTGQRLMPGDEQPLGRCPEPRTAEQYEKSVYYPDGSKRT